MLPFFSILFILLFANAFMMVFSVNGKKDSIKKPLQNLSENKLTDLYTSDYTETEYKKAV
ncbi:MAG: hypothetical protein KJO73_00965 [Croceitalea sp.]|nr:hypothetical protein [Croceitalea sp.]NNC33683.1 hypothetical protein [Croceitalea sp.]